MTNKESNFASYCCRVKCQTNCFKETQKGVIYLFSKENLHFLKPKFWPWKILRPTLHLSSTSKRDQRYDISKGSVWYLSFMVSLSLKKRPKRNGVHKKNFPLTTHLIRIFDTILFSFVLQRFFTLFLLHIYLTHFLLYYASQPTISLHMAGDSLDNDNKKSSPNCPIILAHTNILQL